jgi:hypothetical protein
MVMFFEQARQLAIMAMQHIFGSSIGQSYLPGFFRHHSSSVMPSSHAAQLAVKDLQQTLGLPGHPHSPGCFLQYSSSEIPSAHAKQPGVIAKQHATALGHPFFPGYFAQYSYSVIPSMQAMHFGIRALQQALGLHSVGYRLQ